MERKNKFLKAYLKIFGFFNLLFVPTIPIIFGEVFLWQPRNLPTEIMMASLYFAMGLVMIFAARKPEKQIAFVDFLIIGNILHATVMLFAAQNTWQIVVDALPVGVMGGLPLLFYPWGLGIFLVQPAD